MIRNISIISLFFSLQFVHANQYALPFFGDGTDGDLTISSGETIVINQVNTTLSSSCSSGQSQISISSPVGFSINDKILIIRMYHPISSWNYSHDFDPSNSAGQNETRVITDISGNTFTLEDNLQYSYTSSTQVIKIPNHSNVTIEGTISSNNWDGSTGGVIVFSVSEQLIITGGFIETSGNGFRGGEDENGNNSSNSIGQQGEGIMGNESSYDNNFAYVNGGGGGTACFIGSGGGGGGYAESGHGINDDCNNCGCSPLSRGGIAIFTNTWQDRLLFGGGGGGGGTNNSGSNASDGGNGGGIIFIFANNIVNNGSISAAGASPNQSATGYGGAGGGGAGGTVRIIANSFSGSSPSISGGGGGTAGDTHWWRVGGSGSSGRSRLDLPNEDNLPASGFDFIGFHGCTDSGANNYSANATIEIGNCEYADFTADILFGDVQLSVSFTDLSIIEDGEIIDWLWDFGDGQTSTEINPTHSYISGNIYTVTLTLTNQYGYSNTKTRTDYIYVNQININEIMQNPSAVSDNDGEWFEIYNGSDVSVNLNGWILSDNGTDEHVIDSDVIIVPGGYGVLGNNADSNSNGGVSIDYEYNDFSFGNSDDEIILKYGIDFVIDSVAYDGGTDFPDPSGASMALLEPDIDNNVGANWVESTTAFGDGDLGTPGAPNFDAEIILSSTSITMDTTSIGSISTKELTIQNTGTELLTLASLSTATDEFDISPTDGTISIGSSLIVTVTFSPDYPDHSQLYSDVLTIMTDDFEDSTLTISLSGYGYRPVPLVNLPSNLTFQDTPEFSSSTEVITITNTGDTTLAITSIVSDIGVFQPDISIGSVEPGSSLDLPVTFTPVNHEAYSGMLTIESNPYNGNLESGYSLRFDGENDYVDLNYNYFTLALGESENCNYTISLYVYIEDLSDDVLLFGNNSDTSSGVSLQAKSNGGIVLKVGGPYQLSESGLIYVNNWYHILVNTDCYNNNSLWVNGVEHEIEDANMDLSYPVGNVYIGTSNGITNQYFKGKMDELSIFHSLINLQNFNNYNFAEPENIPDLMGYYNFNSGSGDILHDLSGNGNNGTIYEAFWNEEPGQIIYTYNLISLSGNGVRYCEFSPEITTLSFGDVQVGLTPTLPINVTNSGTIHNLEIEFDGTSPIDGVYTPLFDTVSIPPGETTALNVQFAPSSQTSFDNATLSIITNDPNNPNISFILNGAGIASNPDIEISVNEIDFGQDIDPDATVEQTFSITNAGLEDLEVEIEIYLDSESLLAIDIDELSLEPNQSGSINVSFTNTGNTIYLDTLLITSNDPLDDLIKLPILANTILGCTDIAGYNYNLDANYDDGSCEYYTGPSWYVDPTGSDEAGIGYGMENTPFSSIQKGINTASNGDTVFVAAGTYNESINFSGKNIVVKGEDRETTIINGAGGTVVRFENGETEAAVLASFTVRNGSSSNGGGVYCYSTNPILTDLIISGNSASYAGAGIYSEGPYTSCGPGCNVSAGDLASGPTIENTSIINNSGGSFGTAIYCYYSNMILNHSVIAGNNGSNLIYVFNSVIDIDKITVTDNTGEIIRGYATGAGGDASLSSLSVNVNNSIFWTDGESATFFNLYNPDWRTITCSLFPIGGTGNGSGWWGGGGLGNITDYYDSYASINPLFADPDNGDYSLQLESPALDAGCSGTDPDGTTIDMGAFVFDHINGCTDSDALNYDPLSITDDGSCLYTPPLADFSATPTSGYIPFEVQFTDQSVGIAGTVIGWSWNFGDGNTSTDQNPSHTYETYGVYDVSLTVTDNNGNTSSAETKTDYITVNYAGPTWYVSNTGNDTGQGTAGDPFATINNATIQASSGDSILVYEGIYTSIENWGKSLFISSIHYPDIDSTTIQNTQVGHIQLDVPDISVNINGFFINGNLNQNNIGLFLSGGVVGVTDTTFIKNCYMNNFEFGSGAYINDDINAKFENCIFDNNYHGISSWSGTNIYIVDSKIRYNDCTLNGYSGHLNGSAIWTNHYYGASMTIINTEISNNKGNETIYLSYDGNVNESLVMDNVQIIDNEGDGISTGGQSITLGSITLNNLTISNNTGVGINNIRKYALTNSTISNNLSGGIVDLYESTLENVIISRNKSEYNGAGIIVETNCTLNNVIIENNQTLNGDGGGIYFSNLGPVILENVTIRNNYAKRGGGIYNNISNLIFSETNKSNIYNNYAISGTDIWNNVSDELNVVLDTFTVVTPTDYYAYPISNITFDITNHTVEPIIGDIYVNPAGSNDNNGTTSASPYKTISYALLSAFANSSNPSTIHLSDGTYSPSTNGEYFPLGGKDYVSISGTSQAGTILNGDSLTPIFYFEDIDDLTISDLMVTNGYNTDYGGGISFYNTNSTLTNLIVSNNNANAGGGISIHGGEVNLDNIIINNNSSTSVAGGVYLYYVSKIILNNVLAYENIGSNGGWMYTNGSDPIINNVTIYNNISNGNGGAIYCDQNSNPIVLNSSIRSNNPNEIYFGLYNDYVYTISVAYSDLEGGVDGILTNNDVTVNWLDGNIEVDPLFADTLNGDYHLQDYSPLIGAGIDSLQIDGTWYFAPTTDIEGNPRPNPEGSNPDIGAYENALAEYIHNTFIYVTTTGIDEGSFGFESAPFATIQAAIDYSEDGDTISVAAGTYTENITWPATNGIKLIGSGVDDCFIDGGSIASVIRFEEDLGGIIDATTLITGFTVRNGNAQGDNGYHNGGGMYLFSSSPTLTGVTFSDNTANYGGGMYLHSSSNPTLTDITFSGNSAVLGGGMYLIISSPTLTNVIFSGNTTDEGGGMYLHSSSNPTLTNVTFNGNSAAVLGGGMCLWASSNPTLTNLTFSSNTAHSGGGMNLYESSSTLTNVTFSGNTATDFGGGMKLDSSSPTLTYVTFSDNLAEDGGGMYLSSSSPTLTNSILWGNSPQEIYLTESTINISYSDIQGGWAGTGNIDADPLFVDPANGDYHLKDYSPCIGAGTATGAPTTDIEGNPRPNPEGSNPDMGAYENALGIPLHGGPVYYVSTTGDDTGTGSEVYPFATIQKGIDTSSDGDTVLVADGTYPSVGIIDFGGKNIVLGSLFLQDNDSTHTHSTILEDASIILNESEGATTVIRGLTLDGGAECGIEIDGASPTVSHMVIKNRTNRGMKIQSTSNLTFDHLTIKNNTYNLNWDGAGGSAVTILGSENIIFNYCYIDSNITPTHGAVYMSGSGSPNVISDVTFNNSSISYNNSDEGGGIHNNGQKLTIIDSKVNNNTSSNQGGGIFCEHGYEPLYLENVDISYNISEGESGNDDLLHRSGGGLYLKTNEITIVNCTIDSNVSSHYGGGIFIYGGNSGSVIIDSTRIRKNTAQNAHGGGIYIDAKPVSITNTLISENTASSKGGGAYIANMWAQTFTNVTMANNIADHGGGFEAGVVSQPTIFKNCIIYDNTPNDHPQQSATTTYSNIGGGFSGTGNIDTDPLFVDSDNGDYNLQSGSPCIDTGDPSGTDPDGTRADMGAYFFNQTEGCTDNTALNFNPNSGVNDGSCEYYEGPVWYVNTQGSDEDGVGFGMESAPYATIQKGIDTAPDGDTVYVYAGTYVENINFNGKNIAVKGEDRETTIVDGNQSGSVVTFENGETNNALLMDFTITNGSGSLDWSGHHSGAGIYVYNSSPILNNLIITNNKTPEEGSGGGIIVIGDLNNQKCYLYNSIINDNEATSGAGFNTITWGNGGALVIENCLVINNKSRNGWGAAGAIHSEIQMTNVTIANNYNLGDDDYGVLSFHDGSDNTIATITNTIIYNNDNTISPLMLDLYPSTGMSIEVKYSNIQSGFDGIAYSSNNLGSVNWGDGNIDDDPIFTDPANGDYTLQYTSPCIDKGDPDLDGDGQTWYVDTDDQDPDGTRLDMGAYPFDQIAFPIIHGCMDSSADNFNPDANVASGCTYDGPVYYVSTQGSDFFGIGSEQNPFLTIQKGIDVVSDGDTVMVTAGTYTENISLNKTIILMSSEGADNTIIDANNFGTVVTISDGIDATLHGFTLQNGYTSGPDTKSGGLIVLNNDAVIKNCIIQNNQGAQGGGIYTGGGSFYNCVIFNNNAEGEGGGVFLYYPSSGEYPLFENCLIANNHCYSGAGIYGWCRLANTTVVNNTGGYVKGDV